MEIPVDTVELGLLSLPGTKPRGWSMRVHDAVTEGD